MQPGPDTSREKPSRKPEELWWKPAIRIFGEITGWIVVPIVGALYAGQYLDEKYGTQNRYFLILTGIAFLITCSGIGLIAVRYIKSLEKNNKNHVIKNGNERNTAGDGKRTP